MRRNFYFFFLRAGGLPRVLEGLGWWWSPRLWARPSKKTWRREAICLSVQALNISVLLYTVYLSFNAHSVTHSAIIWQYWSKSHSMFISSDTFLVKEKPVMSLSCSVYEIQTQKILAWITKWRSLWLSPYNLFLDVKLPHMSWTALYSYTVC